MFAIFIDKGGYLKHREADTIDRCSKAKLHRSEQEQKRNRKQPFHTLKPMGKGIEGGGRVTWQLFMYTK